MLICTCSTGYRRWQPACMSICFLLAPLVACLFHTDSVFRQAFAKKAVYYCIDLFWGRFGGDWKAVYARWSTALGIPDLDKNAWADSCPNNPGYDELGNLMAYNTPACLAALGHLTPEQVQFAKYRMSEYNPVMYAWAQYYAYRASPPPPQASPPPLPANTSCMEFGCPCNSNWVFEGETYSYCDRVPGYETLMCMVADPSSCISCSKSPCLLSCAGTSKLCRKPSAPRELLPPPGPPPPPFPPSPPPKPPPPPPESIPSSCKISSLNCTCRSSWTSLRPLLLTSFNYGTNAWLRRDTVLPNLLGEPFPALRQNTECHLLCRYTGNEATTTTPSEIP
ncbi:hypothetical protein VOLCADRAFT_103515 [Volvox carteri f. nagariensis]|uniref:Uncharacterized protein n=1 Tax=Volvox carteri f. nagariensis TaxID=3068 RepID=D8TMD7_VOLCA|nr:uncharacterized protein VOLCADRAFT_103515 [Volvox carteri f. nagariensis]EFJ51485.1 hypothetical protein VOLCADRAFT_103515 [Volvox carteri f. nagariensis]|eukprot:XP_002947437.1 hypothetical protein VOLCADRAFT_103515 [Volvox carteri f. nagariensis]